jgi:phenylacetate-CoA ligase
MRARDTYGLSEIIGPGVAFECSHADGMHVNADHFIPEIIDESGTPLPAGEWGELVLSAPTRQARPLIRYRTGDRTRLDPTPCPCGRTLPRIARIRSRVDDMRVVRGVNVYPAHVADVLASFSTPFGGWCMEVTRPAALDVLTLVVESPKPHLVALSETLQAALRPVLGLRVEVRLVAPGSLPHSGGKARRWRDLRSIIASDG